MATDYTASLNLPKTAFSMKANLPQKEPTRYQKWLDEGIYEKLMEKNADKPSFIFHDGPPYANGNIHLGHALNKTLKDIIVRSKNMGGYRAPYVHGWDTHGLPIEKAMIKKQNVKRNELDPVQFRKLCEEFAYKNVANQKAQMQRLGVLGDWDQSYLTLLPGFEAEQVRIFGKMAEKGYIYKGMKPVYWCPSDETALAEAEIEYSEDPCDSIYVKFSVCEDKGLITPYVSDLSKVYFVIWTTTTWTLPGNLAICLNGEYSYSLIQVGDEYYIMATELLDTVAQVAGIADRKTVATFTGAQLEGMVANHPFMDRPSYIITGDHVTLESGTGCVHTAPGFGAEDFAVCQKYDFIETVVPVDEKGRMNALAGKYCGLTTAQANEVILEDLKSSGALLATQKIIHQYPHCWRCKSPIIFRATEQWFCSVEGFREEALRAIKEVKWMPAWGELRMENMVRDRSDWCISRQRNWGVPIPIFYCEDCGEPLLTPTTIEKVADLFEKEGAGAWLTHTAQEILGEDCVCKCGCKNLRKEKDIMDVWFDSGSSYAYVLGHREGHSFPADLYLEGNDQYRGWFQSSLLTSVATRGCAPYRSVLTHGMIIDEERRKMSKSLGNGIDPLDVTKNFGADILRLWVSSVDYTADAKISDEILKQIAENYRKIRNTARMMLANVEDFDPANPVPYAEMQPIDRWALARYDRLVQGVRASYDNYSFHLIFQAVNTFCTVDMSKLYIDIIKDRLYVEEKNSLERRSAQTALYEILSGLTRLIAPILAFTADELWESIPHTAADDTRAVVLNEMPAPNAQYGDTALEEKYNALFDLRDTVMKALEEARTSGMIGKSLEAQITLTVSDAQIYDLFADFQGELATVFIVSKVTLQKADAEVENGFLVKVEKAEGHKCDRCWTYTHNGIETEDGFLCARCKNILGK